jgi:hypothetical protein
MSQTTDEDPTALARRVNDLRVRVLAGEQIPPEEYAEIISDLRQARMKAAASTRPKTPAKTKNLDPDSIMF